MKLLVSVSPPRTGKKLFYDRGNRGDLFGRPRLVALMPDRHEPQPRAGETTGSDGRHDSLMHEIRPSLQPPFVVNLRRERCDIRMQPPRLIKKQPELRRHRLSTAQQMVQRRNFAAFRVAAL